MICEILIESSTKDGLQARTGDTEYFERLSACSVSPFHIESCNLPASYIVSPLHTPSLTCPVSPTPTPTLIPGDHAGSKEPGMNHHPLCLFIPAPEWEVTAAAANELEKVVWPP